MASVSKSQFRSESPRLNTKEIPKESNVEICSEFATLPSIFDGKGKFRAAVQAVALGNVLTSKRPDTRLTETEWTKGYVKFCEGHTKKALVIVTLTKSRQILYRHHFLAQFVIHFYVL